VPPEVFKLISSRVKVPEAPGRYRTNKAIERSSFELRILLMPVPAYAFEGSWTLVPSR
jgi:hypothetical protein